ncbi:MAG: glycoside hydrolase family 15 protein [Myxococcales bacterium]|nr:glycoside hydrolase family 15 protein [Myxococcales bacterium]
MGLRIEDYALIGDCQSAALVGIDGSIDWLCFPRFDAGACFAALLGTAENGRWRVAPSAPVRKVSRRYRDSSLVLETTFETDEGTVTVIDFMPPRDREPNLVRMIRGDRGAVDMHMELVIRFDYGQVVPWVRRVEGGIRAVGGPDTLYCLGDVPMVGEDLHTVSTFRVQAGETKCLSLVYAPTHEPCEPRPDPHTSLDEAESFWAEWTGRCTYQGPWREAVIRSLITLKAMTYAPSGGLVASVTSSLPEQIGGSRNWDYRYCWLRDATFTLYALISGGYVDEAAAWRKWLINAVAGSPDKIQIMYGVAGERRLSEHELPWLAGYRGSVPVRMGNAAHEQHQLDVYGEVMDALHLARRAGISPDENAWRVQRGLIDFLERDWRKPDEGIWEVRGPRRQFTHSKVMAWVAFDRAIKAVERSGQKGPSERWKVTRAEIRAQVLEEGFNSTLNTFTQFYGGHEADASLLMIPLVGFLPASDPRMVGTVAYIQKHLDRNGFVARYDAGPEIDGMPAGEGAFLLCSFWLADNLVLQGRHDEAQALFEKLLALRNDVGLLAEEYDVHQGHFLGNFPQAFSHVGLINTALNLANHGPARERAEASP